MSLVSQRNTCGCMIVMSAKEAVMKQTPKLFSSEKHRNWFLVFKSYDCVCMMHTCGYTCCNACVEVRGQLFGVGSLSLPCRSWVQTQIGECLYPLNHLSSSTLNNLSSKRTLTDALVCMVSRKPHKEKIPVNIYKLWNCNAGYVNLKKQSTQVLPGSRLFGSWTLSLLILGQFSIVLFSVTIVDHTWSH